MSVPSGRLERTVRLTALISGLVLFALAAAELGNDAIGLRHAKPRDTFSHLACWLNIESTMWMKAS